MQQIERYGVIALVFLLVTIVAVSFWGDSKSPGFWSRLTGRGTKKDAVASQVQASPEIASTPAPEIAPVAATGERALQTELPLSTAGSPESAYAGTVPPSATPMTAPSSAPTALQAVAPEVASAPPAPAFVAAPPAPAASTVVYTVQQGDSLMRIAARTLGQKNRWTEIRDLNQGVDPRNLRIGMKLALPASAARAGSPEKRSTPVRKPAVAPATQKKPAAPATDTYLVRKGDTLKEIAERRLGQSSRWREIAAANPGLDPNRLLVGKTIRIPAGKSKSRPQASPTPAVAAAMPRQGSSGRPQVR